MGEKILLILTEKDKNLATLKEFRVENIEKIFLCPVEYNAEGAARGLNNFLHKELNIETAIIDFKDRFNREAFTFKKDYIDFIHEAGEKEFIPGLNFKKYFTYPSEDFSLWWFSLVSEKNPYKTSSFTWFCKILTILRLKRELECGQIWLTKNSGPLHNIFCALGQNYTKSLPGFSNNHGWPDETKIIFIEIVKAIKFILVLLKRNIDVKKLKNHLKDQKKQLESCDITILTAFPFVDEEKLKEGKFINSLYGSLQNGIEENYKKKIIWLGMFTSANSRAWTKAIKIAKKAKETTALFILEEWLSLKVFSRIISIYCKLVFRAFRILKISKKHFIYKDEIALVKLNLWEIVKKDFISSFFGKALIWSISDYEVFSNAISDLPRNSKILYFAEMQGWEKALNIACRKRKDITCIGMQHTIVPLLYLNYFDHPQDLKGPDLIRYSPTPDYLGCVGSITRDIFLKNNWPKEKLFILGGFRFHNLIHSRPNHNSKKNQIVVPFSISPIENQEMLLLVYNAFKDKNSGFTVLLKSHPCDSVEKMAKALKLNMDERIFKFTDKNLEEIVPESKVMIVKESSSIFWALYHQIPVIVPSLYSIVDLCPLSGINDLVTYVKNQDELFCAVNDFIQDKKVIPNGAYREFFNKYLEIYPQERQYYENIREAVKQ